MPDCPYCEFMGEVLFSDENIVAGLPVNPAVPGHAVVFPKRHVTIFEQLPGSMVSAMFDAANRLSTSMFEALRAQGTNLIVMSGNSAGQRIPHISIEVVPRAQNDGLSFAWPTRKLSDEQMGLVEQQFKAAVIDVSLEAKPAVSQVREAPEPAGDAAQPPAEPRPRKRRDDPFTRQLRRLP
ncbi:HIT family protein [Candidatus Woesearchaeota archaeon]|nr:HIT family protein [Candidatus Woesearchaeota archaeon]